MRGPAQAPPLIRQAFHCDSTNTWSELGIDLNDESILYDAGDVVFESGSDTFDHIREAVTELLDKGYYPISLGGDHAITYPIIQTFRRKYGRLNILHLDAHPDLYDEMEGKRHLHCSPFARIMEEGLVERLVQVGIRGMNGHQREQADKFGVEVHEMKTWNEDTPFHFKDPLYISLDLDALDPAFAPGVSHFEPGGLSTRQAIGIFHQVQAPEIVGADIVEYNPERDPSGVTAMVCAKLLKEIAGRMVIKND
jgi:agmatinase